VHARFHAPAAEAPGDHVTLLPDEAAHLTRVLRLGIGAAVRVFNGRGAEFHGIVDSVGKDGVGKNSVGKNSVDIIVGERCDPIPERRTRITLAAAVLKGDKMDDVVRDAVMMGVATIQPLVTARTEVRMATLAHAHRRERWERVAIASVKQCGRAVLPAVLEPREFNLWLPGADVHREARSPRPVLLVEPGASAEAGALADLDGASPLEATIVVGPEGGWDAEEIARAAATCRLVTLRTATLRADATPIVALAALLAHWGDL
jgi:16S rRNA (uracil1498-N3)-methyltransferase